MAGKTVDLQKPTVKHTLTSAQSGFHLCGLEWKALCDDRKQRCFCDLFCSSTAHWRSAQVGGWGREARVSGAGLPPHSQDQGAEHPHSAVAGHPYVSHPGFSSSSRPWALHSLLTPLALHLPKCNGHCSSQPISNNFPHLILPVVGSIESLTFSLDLAQVALIKRNWHRGKLSADTCRGWSTTTFSVISIRIRKTTPLLISPKFIIY